MSTRKTSTKRSPSSVDCWRSAEGPAHELRREEQDQARKSDLERTLGDVVREHGAADSADRRQRADREGVAQPYVAVLVLAPGADECNRHDRHQRCGLRLDLALTEE